MKDQIICKSAFWQIVGLCDRIFHHKETKRFSGEFVMDDTSTKKISRRDAMKILAVVAGASALASVPSKWTKPGLDIGVLPVHAATSGGHTLAAGASDPAANFCWPLISTATISPVATGILMHYAITTGGIVSVTIPAALSGTVPTDASGVASLSISVNITPGAFNAGDTVTVTWSFQNTSDGTGSGVQVFTSAGSGC